MKAALLIVLSLSALAYAGPAFNKNANSQIAKQQQQQYMTTGNTEQTKAIESLKQWCFSSQMSQTELTGAFKKLVDIIKSAPLDQQTESAVMNERICQGAIVQKSSQSGQTLGQTGADAQAHELIKDVYMDSLIACESRECMQQLLKIINSNQVDQIRASYYMTRLAITEKKSIKDESEVKQLVELFISNQQQQPISEAVERQKLFAVTSILGKLLEGKQTCTDETCKEHKRLAEQVAKTIVERYIRPVSKQDVEQYKQQPEQQPEVSKKIAKRNAGLKALANVPAFVIKSCGQVEQELSKIAEDKQEQSSARQSAIECLEGLEQADSLLEQITFDQAEPIEVRIAAYRALMTETCDKDVTTIETSKQQMIEQIVKHCEEQRNQQDDDQFVLYVVSHLDNLRTSQQPEQQVIREVITKNKQLYMQIQLLNKKFKQQLSQVSSSSRNYQLSQALSQIKSGLVIEGDMIFESKNFDKQQQQQQPSVLPKVVRFNMSMPVMGETVNVIEVTVRQNQMDQELLGALKVAQGAKFSSEAVSKVVDSFKNSASKSGYGKKVAGAPECDMSIKFENKNIIYISSNDFKSTAAGAIGSKRDTRSIGGVQSSSSIGQLVEELVQHLKREPVAFNRGINVHINERLAKLLDIEASMIAGLRFETRAGVSAQSGDDFEILAEIEPRFAFEAIVGPAKVSSKRLLQRFSTKTALGLRLRYRADELVDVQVDLPMNNMDIFTVESQLVERDSVAGSYSYLPESIYGRENIYAPEEEFVSARGHLFNSVAGGVEPTGAVRKMKRSIFENNFKSVSGFASFAKMMRGKQSSFASSLETPEEIARAVGLSGKLRVVVSPKDMSFFAQASCQKTEPSMQGYRVQLQRSQRASDQKQYTVTLSTPGSRTERTMQVRVISQCGKQRTVLKSDVQAGRLAATMQLELVHDGRQYGAKIEVASSRGKQWRHQLECGVQRSQQSQAGRLALTYKPYLSVQSSELRRPVQLQGVLSYQQQSPKSVISYELKSPTSADFVQGKLTFEQRPSGSGRAGQFAGLRRSLKSPIMVLVSQSELVMSGELVAQLGQHQLKTHQMVDWSASRLALDSTFNCMHKDLRKSQEQQLTGSVKLSPEQQMLLAERRCPQQARRNVRVAVESQLKAGQHQLSAETRFADNQLLAYKQKLDYSRPSRKSMLVNYQLELVSTGDKINERAQGRVEIDAQPMMKLVRAQMSAGQRKGQLSVEYSSPVEHQIELSYQGKQYQHKCAVRAAAKPAAKFELDSLTSKQGQSVNQIQVRAYPSQESLVFEFQQPGQQTHIAGELKFKQGEQSSVAIKTGRFSSKAELVVRKASGLRRQGYVPRWMRPVYTHQYQFKGDLKDQLKRNNYWLESAFNGIEQEQPKSYFRFDSPAMRSELEFEPRTYSARMAAFGRQKRSDDWHISTDFADTILDYSEADFAKRPMELADKSWMTRSILTWPRLAEKEAVRYLSEFVNKNQQHKHSFDYSPREQRLNFNFDTKPTAAGSDQWWSPMRASGVLIGEPSSASPSSVSLVSNWADLDLTGLPFSAHHDQDAFVRLSALSRARRSTLGKHECELRYSKKHQGYKAWMKHQDKEDKVHSLECECDQDPRKWAKLSYKSERLGKGQWEHQWRKQQQSGDKHYLNKVNVDTQSPSGQWAHRTDLQWEEPVALVSRVRRGTTTTSFNDDDGTTETTFNDDHHDRGNTDTTFNRANKYTTLDYLKHANARLQSQLSKDRQQMYKVDFDYQPRESRAKLDVNMPSDMLHSSSFEFEPRQNIYKLASSLANERTKVPVYQLHATTKPAFMEQSKSGVFGQPLEFNYSDVFGRQARLNYDDSPLTSQDAAGLRMKRAAVYYKDDAGKLEHESTFDFYPAGSARRTSQQADEQLLFKSQTKYGPVVMRVDSERDSMQVELDSPVVKAKLAASGEQPQVMRLYVSNKEQTCQLAKIVRKSPVLSQIELLHKLAKKIDQGRFEHESELVMSLIEGALKLKSQTSLDQRPVVSVEGELNRQQDKAYFKIDGPRVKGQLVLDLANKSCNLHFDVDDKRTMQHYTRLVRLADNFYSLDSATSYKQQPLAKLTGKLSSMIFEQPEHLFAAHRRRPGLDKAHVSSVEAVVYQPKPVQLNGLFDCVNNDLRLTLKDLKDKSESALFVHFDQQADKLFLDAQKSSPRGLDYKIHKTIDVPQLVAY